MIAGSTSVCLCIASLSFAISFAKNLPYYKTRGYFSSDLTLVFIAPGSWCGAITFISGILGRKVKKRPTIKMYNCNIIMSFISIVAMITLTSITATAGISISYCREIHITQGLSALTAIIGLIISILHLIFACAGRSGLTDRRTLTPCDKQGKDFC